MSSVISMHINPLPIVIRTKNAKVNMIDFYATQDQVLQITLSHQRRYKYPY